jgi:hypothetical protein
VIRIGQRTHPPVPRRDDVGHQRHAAARRRRVSGPTPPASLDWPKFSQELLHRCLHAERHATTPDRLSWVALDHGKRPNRLRHDTAGCNDSPMADRDVWKDDDTRSNERVIFYPHSRRVWGWTPEMCDDDASDSDRYVGSDDHQMGIRSLDQSVGTDECAVADRHATQAMKANPKRRSSGRLLRHGL